MRSLRIGSIVFSLIVIGMGAALVIDKELPGFIRQYWPIGLAAWGLGNVISNLISREDSWAGTDYGTGLYVIRHRRRRPNLLLPGLALILIGGFFTWANLDVNSGITFGPFVVIGLGIIALINSFAPPPSRDF